MKGSRDTSREASPKSDSIRERGDKRQIRPLAKAFPVAQHESSFTRAVSVLMEAPEKTIRGRQHAIPSMPAPLSGAHPSNTTVTTPRLRRPPPAAEVDQEGWDPQLTKIWVYFPEEIGPIFGWFRESAGPWLDTFFGSNGSFRNTSKDALSQYTLSTIASPKHARPPEGLILHLTLYSQVREALHSRDSLRDARNIMSFPVATEKDWQRIS